MPNGEARKDQKIKQTAMFRFLSFRKLAKDACAMESSSPFDRLPDELVLLLFITDCLTPMELLNVGSTHKRLARFARGPDVWKLRIEHICENKAYVPETRRLGITKSSESSTLEDTDVGIDAQRNNTSNSFSKSHLNNLRICDPKSSEVSPKVYFKLLQDANRTRFQDAEELGSLHFHFRYKAAAGPQITSLDPSHNGEIPPMYRRFYADGTMSIHPDSSADRHLWAVGTRGPDPFGEEVECLRWKFGGQKMQHIKVGHYPPLRIARNPVDWGFVLESDWMVFRTCCMETATLDPEWLGPQSPPRPRHVPYRNVQRFPQRT